MIPSSFEPTGKTQPSMTTRVDPNSPIHWPGAITLFGTTIAALILVPAYAWYNDYSTAAWVSFVVLAILNGISITAGYHRLWAHRTYEAHWSVRFVLMFFGTMAVQNSILIWASGHRTHHRHVDDTEHDPYSAKRGFWFSHMGWMIRKYESGKEDLSNSPDLLKDPLVMFQHKHYTALALGINFLFPALIGYLVGDLWGVMLLGGLLRLVWCHQTTFFINSLAHIWGRRPYTDENTARDNDFLAIFTYGEGYHNYHHLFQYDYRNGIKWFHIDPTKWLIAGLSFVGLTKNLKRCDKFAIEKARIAMQFKRAEEKMQAQPTAMHAHVEAMKARLAQEYEHYSKALQDWAKLKEAWYQDTKNAIKNGETLAAYKAKFKAMEVEMRLQRKRLQALVRQVQKPALTA
tara:strand:- start:9130 stop:10338 length:1209 start_codon:yes stop_codon:yes gene_type:complete